MNGKILCSRDGAVATVTLNRPEKRNALDSESWRVLGEVVRGLSDDAGLRCVVITGAGDKAFAAGNDITEFEAARGTSEQVRSYNATTAATVRAIEDCLHPTVARIRGYCVGGGLEIALGCDIRVAGASARFGLPVKNMGIFLDPVLADTLVNAVGRATALELVLEGRILDAEEARARGLATRVVADEALDDEVRETVERIAAGAPLAARYNRRGIRRVAGGAAPTEEMLAEAASYGDTEDYHSAYAAFASRSKPDFKGR